MSTDPSAAVIVPIRKPDLALSEGELKLLDLSLQEQQSARDAFLRDFKLALLLVVAFQFLILLRYVRLAEEARANAEGIANLISRQDALHEFRAGVERLRSVLVQGKARLSKEVLAGPEQQHGQMLQLDADLKQVARHSSEPDSVDMMTQQQPVQTWPPRLFSALSPDQMRQLKQAYTSKRIDSVRALVTPTVRARILEPYFASLNSDSQTFIARPFRAKTAVLTRIIRGRSGVLTGLGIAPDSIAEDLSIMAAKVDKLHFSVPESNNWWTTTGGKGEVFGELESNTDKMVGGLNQQLSKLSASTIVVDNRLRQLLQEAESKRDKLDDQIKELQARSDKIHGYLADVAKPFQLVTVQVQDAVIYFPCVVAVIWSYLTFEYLILSHRVRHLVSAYKAIGFADSAIKLYFAGVPGSTLFSAIVSSLLFALPISMAVWAASYIGSSKTLQQVVPGHVYLFAEALLFACLGFFLTALLRCRVALRHIAPH